MSFDRDKLYALLPALYRVRDDRQGEPLKALLSVIAGEVAVLEEDLAQLYDDQFIETCAPWVVPYIGDLIGQRALHGELAAMASPRAEVANAIRYRRRKGTAAVLEKLARDVTQWRACAVEFFERLVATQYMNHPRPQALASADLRDWRKLALRGTAFDGLAHTVDVRAIADGGGRYNVPNVGIFLWRVAAYRLARIAPAADLLDSGGRRFRFNPLGADIALYAKPQREISIDHRVEALDVPRPLSLRIAKADLDRYYGADKSIHLELAVVGASPVPFGGRIDICDLSDVRDAAGAVIGWAHEDRADPGDAIIDPDRGRLVFGSPPAAPVLATCHYGFTLDIGGGDYERGDKLDRSAGLRLARGGAGLQADLDAVAGAGGAVQIEDSLRYAAPSFSAAAGTTLTLQAKNFQRPLLEAAGPVKLELGADATLVLDGLVIAGGALVVDGADDGKTRKIVLRHCTLVPGLSLLPDGAAAKPGKPSLVVAHQRLELVIEHCIVGPLHLADGVELSVRSSIVDACSPSGIACRGPDGARAAAGRLEIDNSTVIGKVHTRLIERASNTLFDARLAKVDDWDAPLWAERRQEGCVRFSYVPPGSLTPPRFQCPPGDADDGRVRPGFVSRRYLDPGYCQLTLRTAAAIRRGADDEGEIGVMHDLYQPQREASLRLRLDEYLRYGLQAGVFYAS